MFILMPMHGNGIQTPHEEQPEPICLGILHFLTPVEDFLEEPSDPRFCSPPPLNSSKVHFDKKKCAEVAQSDADTNSHLRTVKWVVLGKLQGQTLVRLKGKRLQCTFSHSRGLPATRPFQGSIE